MAAPTAKLAAGTAGVQTTTAPAGIPLTAQVALLAMLGPLLVHVTVPVTVLPAFAVAGNPLTAAAISACGVTLTGSGSTLFAGTGSAVLLPAVVTILSDPVAGAVKVDVHVILLPTGNGFGAGFGVQVCVAPAGSPLSTQVSAAAGLGPLFVHVPVAVTLWPAFTVAGTVVTACMSAC
jgi:hypothetical protein